MSGKIYWSTKWNHQLKSFWKTTKEKQKDAHVSEKEDILVAVIEKISKPFSILCLANYHSKRYDRENAQTACRRTRDSGW